MRRGPPFQVILSLPALPEGRRQHFGTAALFRRVALRIVRGEPAWFQSSVTVKRGFCSTCGSPITAQHTNRDHTAIWLGSLDEPGGHVPSVQWHCDTRLSWVTAGSDLPDETDQSADC